MELALTIVAIIGILLFVIAYLRFVISGFKHHPVTGIIAMFPVINLLVVPSLWYKNGRFLIIGFVGLLLAAGAWTMGAEKGAYKYINLLLGKDQQTLISKVPKTTPTASTSTSLSIPNSKKITQVAPTSMVIPTVTTVASTAPSATTRTRVIDESNLESLPTKALYKMSFDSISVKEIISLKGRVVRVIDKNLTPFEGRIISVNPSSVSLQLTGNSANMELPIANILKLSLMVKKPL